jgi:hypothetical protein
MFSKIPGFRSNKRWKKIVGSIGYSFMAFTILAIILSIVTSFDKAVTDAKAVANVKIKTDANQKATIQPPVQKNSVDDTVITNGAGLGDSVNVLKNFYGSPTRVNQPIDSNGFGMLNYSNDLYIALFQNNYVSNLTMQYEALGSDHHVSRIQADADVRRIIPRDAVKVKEYSKDHSLDVVVYTSQLIIPRFTEDDFKNADGVVQKGTFDVMYGHDENGLIFDVVVAPGDNP